jgi:tRNA(Leu) C34 or U34 (ribose-2'-O)-methylase TrmL
MAQNNRETSETHYCGVGLWNPKNGFNIGGALRACGCLGGDFMVVSGSRYREYKSDFRNMDTEFARKRIPLFMGVDNLESYIPYECTPVILERVEGAVSLVDFEHPRRSCYIYGPEDGCVPSELFPDSPRVYVPTHGSLNLASSVYLTLYDRLSKIGRFIVDRPSCPECGSVHISHGRELLEDGSIPNHCNGCGFDWVVSRI